MKNKKHSLGYYAVKQSSKKIKVQRVIIIILSLLLVFLSVWFGISGGK